MPLEHGLLCLGSRLVLCRTGSGFDVHQLLPQVVDLRLKAPQFAPVSGLEGNLGAVKKMCRHSVSGAHICVGWLLDRFRV